MVAVLSQCNSSKCPSGAQRKQGVCVSARYGERCSAVRAVCRGGSERACTEQCAVCEGERTFGSTEKTRCAAEGGPRGEKRSEGISSVSRNKVCKQRLRKRRNALESIHNTVC